MIGLMLIVGDSERADQPDMRADRRQRPEQRQRLETVQIMGSRFGGDIYTVCDKCKIKLGRFCCL